MRGKFIVLEGGEGSGKTTVARHLHGIFGGVLTREPGGTKAATKIRELLLHDQDFADVPAAAKFGLFWAARADHIAKVIRPALERGEHVFCDRFDGSTYAYQISAEGGSEFMRSFEAFRHCYLGEVRPDAYLFFDVDPAIGMGRVEGRGERRTHYDAQTARFHEAVRSGYRQFLVSYAECRCVIDASQPLADVQRHAEQYVRELIESKTLAPCG